MRDKNRSDGIKQTYDIMDIIRWGRKWQREWNGHLSGMGNDRPGKIARYGKIVDICKPPGWPNDDSATVGNQLPRRIKHIAGKQAS